MTPEELRAAIASPSVFAESKFEILREIANLSAQAEDERDEAKESLARELIIRCLERSSEMGDATPIHQALLVRVGLFPYLAETDEMELADRLELEAHRPLATFREPFVFHEKQAEVYARLMDGESVILAAPTSFGKTLIVDALVASGRFSNIVVVVPTIALIDEVRRRLTVLSAELELGFKVVTHPGQSQAEKNIFVFTQERLLEESSLPAIDLGVIDEFYKLSIDRDVERGTLLNLALAKLRRKTKQLYLLGPSVGELRELPTRFQYRYIPSNDSTVAVDVIDVHRTPDERTDFLAVCASLSESTLIYVKSPARAHQVARWLVEADLGLGGPEAAADWVADAYHLDWTLVSSLRRGIGIHHGRIPRALAHYMITAFNDERLRFLVCTQTLIEGVNTTAKNIVILDNTIDRKRLDLFTFRNIQGRAGRMFNHFVGRVFLFNAEPDDELPTIDIPALTQPDNTPAELLLGLEEDELEPRSKDRLAPYYEQDLLSVAVLRENAVDPDLQLALAETLHGDAERWSAEISWRRFPQYEELKATIGLLWTHFPTIRRSWGAWTSDQFTLLTSRAMGSNTPKTIINEQLSYWQSRGDPRDVDDVVLDVLTFFRNGLSFGLPKYLRVLDSIQREVFERHGVRSGDYSQFAAAAEGAFLPAPLATLDEYGLPVQLAQRLQTYLVHGESSLDDVLERLKRLNAGNVARSSFELELIQEAQRGA